MNLWTRFVSLVSGAISRQLTLAFALATGAVMFAFGYSVIEHQSQFLMEQSERSAVDLAHSVAVSSAAWVAENDVIGLRAELKSIARNDNLKYALVLTRAGRVLASLHNGDVGKVVQDPLSLRALAALPARAG